MAILDKIMAGFKKDDAPIFSEDKSDSIIGPPSVGKKDWSDEQHARYTTGVRSARDYVHGKSRDTMFPDEVKNGGYKDPKFDKFVSSFGEDSDFSKHLSANLASYQAPGGAYGSEYNKSFKGMTDILERSVSEGSSYFDD